MRCIYVVSRSCDIRSGETNYDLSHIIMTTDTVDVEGGVNQVRVVAQVLIGPVELVTLVKVVVVVELGHGNVVPQKPLKVGRPGGA